MAGTLYVVATPLGNLGDLSPRAAQLLAQIDLIACEDTRRTSRLLAHLGASTATLSYHEHNEDARVPELIRKLECGQQVALVCDAGTPLLSDPGFRLVRECRERKIEVLPVPGPFAAAAALSVAGLPTDRFFFAAFLPRRRQAQREQLRRLVSVESTLVFYLPPHGLWAILKRIIEVLGDRQGLLAREMTKKFETYEHGYLTDILTRARQSKARGEYTLVVEGRAPAPAKPDPKAGHLDVPAYVAGLMRHYDLKATPAIRRAARQLQIPRRLVYRLYHEFRRSHPEVKEE